MNIFKVVKGDKCPECGSKDGHTGMSNMNPQITTCLDCGYRWVKE
jgi:Zn ribbon nucleic-acid-binding protein